MIQQLEWDPRTDRFLPQAVLDKTTAFFKAKRKITFTSSYDGLDYFEGALLIIDSGVQFVLKHYRRGRPNTTAIYLSPENQDVDHITRTVREIVSNLGLTERDVLWQRKDNPEA